MKWMLLPRLDATALNSKLRSFTVTTTGKGESKIVLGRNRETGCVDQKVSRRAAEVEALSDGHLTCTATSAQGVRLHRVGSNMMLDLSIGQSARVDEGDTIALLGLADSSHYIFRVKTLAEDGLEGQKEEATQEMAFGRKRRRLASDEASNSTDTKNPVRTNSQVACMSNETWESDTQEMVLLIGMPGSGKSTVAARRFGPAGYKIVNRDTLKTMDKCISVARSALVDGKSVVIDNTNPSINARHRFINLVDSLGLSGRCKIRALDINTDQDIAWALNLCRDRKVPMIAFQRFKSEYQTPTTTEGINEVIDIPFKPSFEKDSEFEKCFKAKMDELEAKKQWREQRLEQRRLREAQLQAEKQKQPSIATFVKRHR